MENPNTLSHGHQVYLTPHFVKGMEPKDGEQAYRTADAKSLVEENMRLWDTAKHFEGEYDNAVAENERLRVLIRNLASPEDCWYDHDGGCQAHGYLSLNEGEICPHYEAKILLAETTEKEK